MLSFLNKSKILQDELQSCKSEITGFENVLSALSSSLAIIQFTPGGDVIEANQNFLDVMGYSENQIIGQHHRIFCDADTTKSADYRQFWKKLESGEPNQGLFLRVTKSGQDVWLEASYCPVKDESGRVTKVIKIASDVTPKATRTLEMSSQLEAVSRSMALIEFSPDGKIMFANENFLSTMGYSNNELVGQHHKIFCEKEYAASHEYQNFWQKLNRGEYVSGRVLRVSHSGEKIWLEATYNPIFDHKGRLYKVIKFATNVSESVNAAEYTNDLVFQSSTETNKISQHGKKIVGQAIDSMSNVSNGLKAASDNINSLSQQSEQISNIVNTITAIADQTNLLALNAAIEAARAGEQGRGFAVVADEVRQLAARTSTSTAEIDGVVKRNNQFASDAVKAMESIVVQAEEGTNLIQETGEVINNIEKSTLNMVDVVGKL